MLKQSNTNGISNDRGNSHVIHTSVTIFIYGYLCHQRGERAKGNIEINELLSSRRIGYCNYMKYTDT